MTCRFYTSAGSADNGGLCAAISTGSKMARQNALFKLPRFLKLKPT